MSDKKNGPVPRPKPKPKPKALVQPKANVGTETRRNTKHVKKHVKDGYNNKNLRHETSTQDSAMSMMPSIHPSLLKNLKQSANDQEIEDQDPYNLENSGKQMTQPESDENRDIPKNDNGGQKGDMGGKPPQVKKWSKIEEICDFNRDALEPLRHPFIPPNYERIDSCGVRELFCMETPVNWASLEEKDKAHFKQTLLVQLPAQLPINRFASKDSQKAGEADFQEDGEFIDHEDSVGNEAALNVNVDTTIEGDNNHMSWVTPLPNPFCNIAPGKIGRLTVHQSGRAFLHIGNAKFDATAGFNVNCAEEFCSISPEKKSCVNLAGVLGHVVVTPNFDSLVDKN